MEHIFDSLERLASRLGVNYTYDELGRGYTFRFFSGSQSCTATVLTDGDEYRVICRGYNFTTTTPASDVWSIISECFD
jgi:hypothetical protein